MRRNKMSRKSVVLMISGLSINTMAFLMFRHATVSDMTRGFVAGIGLGMMFIALFLGRKKTARN